MSRTAGSRCAVRYVALGQVAATPAARYATSSSRCRAAGRDITLRGPEPSAASVALAASADAPVSAGAPASADTPACMAAPASAAAPACGASAVPAPGPRPAQFVGSLLSTVPQSRVGPARLVRGPAS